MMIGGIVSPLGAALAEAVDWRVCTAKAVLLGQSDGTFASASHTLCAVIEPDMQAAIDSVTTMASKLRQAPKLGLRYTLRLSRTPNTTNTMPTKSTSVEALENLEAVYASLPDGVLNKGSIVPNTRALNVTAFLESSAQACHQVSRFCLARFK